MPQLSEGSGPWWLAPHPPAGEEGSEDEEGKESVDEEGPFPPSFTPETEVLRKKSAVWESWRSRFLKKSTALFSEHCETVDDLEKKLGSLGLQPYQVRGRACDGSECRIRISFCIVLQTFYKAENKRHRRAQQNKLQTPTHLSAAVAMKSYLATDAGQQNPLKPLMLSYLVSVQASVDPERIFAVVPPSLPAPALFMYLTGQ